MPNLEAIIDRLCLKKGDILKQQLLELQNFPMQHRDLPPLYIALSRNFNHFENEVKVKSILLQFLWTIRDETTPGYISKQFHTLPRDPLIHFSALRVLTEIHSRESLEILLKFLREKKIVMGYTNFHYLWEPLRNDHKWGSIIFPALLEIRGTWEYLLSVLNLAIHYRKLRSIRGKALESLKIPLLNLYEEFSILFDTADNPVAVHINQELLSALIELLGDFYKEERIVRKIIKKATSSAFPALVAAGVCALKLSPAKRQRKENFIRPPTMPFIYLNCTSFWNSTEWKRLFRKSIIPNLISPPEMLFAG